MPAYVLTNARVEFNSVDISQYVLEARIVAQVEAKEDTAMGAGVRTSLPGLKTWSLELQMKQNYDAGAVDATLFPLWNNGTTFTWKLRPVNAAIAVGNPEYSATGFITDYTPAGGSVGEIHQTQVTVVPGGSAPQIVRATS